MWDHMPTADRWSRMDSAGGVIDPSYAGIWDPSVSLLDASWHPRVADLWNAHYAFTPQYRHTFDASAVHSATSTGCLFGLLDGQGSLLGTILGSPQSWVLNGQSVTVGLVDFLCVRSSDRRQGLAARLIEHMAWHCVPLWDTNVFVFHKEVVPCKIVPFELQKHWVAFFGDLAVGQGGLSAWTPQDFHRAYDAYQNGDCYGRQFKCFEEFLQWTTGRGRFTLRNSDGSHLSIVEDCRAVAVAVEGRSEATLCEVVWTNGNICRDSVEYLKRLRRLGFGGVFWGSGLAARPFAEGELTVPTLFSAWSMWYLFNWRHAPLQALWEGRRIQV